MITQPEAPTDAQTAATVEHPEQHKIERAVTSRLQERGCDVPPETVRDEVRRALRTLSRRPCPPVRLDLRHPRCLCRAARRSARMTRDVSGATEKPVVRINPAATATG